MELSWGPSKVLESWKPGGSGDSYLQVAGEESPERGVRVVAAGVDWNLQAYRTSVRPWVGQ